MGTDNGGEDNAASRGLLQRLLSPGSLRLSRRRGDRSTRTTTSPRVNASADETDLIDEDAAPGFQDNDEDEMEYSYWGRPYAQTPKWFTPVTAPQEAGLKLLMSGEFGRIGVETRSRRGSANVSEAILSSRSKLRPTPRQDITNVRAGYMLGVSISYDCRTSSRTPLVRLSRHCQTIYTAANILQVRRPYAPSVLHFQCLIRVA